MIAYMQPSSLPPLRTYSDNSSSSSSGTTSIAGRMSLAILPSSPVTHSQSVSSPLNASTSKRPKLSLNTANLCPVIHKGASSLRLETLSATSPTVRNTFQNTYSPSQPSNLSRTPQQSTPTLTQPSPLSTQLPQSPDNTSATSLTSTSTLDSLSSAPVPYKAPTYPTRSILRNSPLPRTITQKRKLSLAPGACASPMFPTAKRVAFRAPLTETIVTVECIWRHSDLLEAEAAASEGSIGEDGEQAMGRRSRKKKDRFEIYSDESEAFASRHSRTVDGDEDDDPAQCPATPVAGRAKPVLQWKWTLGNATS